MIATGSAGCAGRRDGPPRPNGPIADAQAGCPPGGTLPGTLRGSTGGREAPTFSPADVAQLVEQLICNQQVRGSSPRVSLGAGPPRNGGPGRFVELACLRTLHLMLIPVHGIVIFLCSFPSEPEMRAASPAGGVGTCFLVGYRSGQPGQTVNLLAYAYVGSNPTPTMAKARRGRFDCPRQNIAGVAQLARASAFQAEGRRFESGLPLWSGRGRRPGTEPNRKEVLW